MLIVEESLGEQFQNALSGHLGQKANRRIHGITPLYIKYLTPYLEGRDRLKKKGMLQEFARQIAAKMCEEHKYSHLGYRTHARKEGAFFWLPLGVPESFLELEKYRIPPEEKNNQLLYKVLIYMPEGKLDEILSDISGGGSLFSTKPQKVYNRTR